MSLGPRTRVAARDCSISPVLPRGPSHGGFKLKEGGFGFVIRKKFLLLRHWCRLPREAMDAPLLEVLKVRLYRALSNLIW